jgi:hypothetical protein
MLERPRLSSRAKQAICNCLTACWINSLLMLHHNAVRPPRDVDLSLQIWRRLDFLSYRGCYWVTLGIRYITLTPVGERSRRMVAVNIRFGQGIVRNAELMFDNTVYFNCRKRAGEIRLLSVTGTEVR